jgi:UDP-N-acetylglucosamine 1-carboxyvinyltransferase
LARLSIQGGRPLSGQVRVSGRKNSAVAVIPAALLADGPTRLDNIPVIGDVLTYVAILRAMGARVAMKAGVLTVEADRLDVRAVPYDRMTQMRASYYLLGVLLGRQGEAEIPLPGGCDIGQRPIDQHIKGLRALGAEVEIAHGVVRAKARRLRGARIYLDVTSVGATINLMLAACRAEGTTVIENAAKEPHVVDLATLLNAMGAHVVGAGTDAIRIHGVQTLRGVEHTIIPDEIEAATWLLAAAASGGDVTVLGVIPRHLEPVAAKLREAGVHVEEDGDAVRAASRGRLRAVSVKTLPYPGFPTDAQQPMTACLAAAEGNSVVTESIWDGRFKHVEELKRMGARIRVEGRTAFIEGVPRLTGAPVRATDLRAGAALIVAGLGAEGTTEVDGCEHIDRGYEAVEGKLAALGAEVRRLP